MQAIIPLITAVIAIFFGLTVLDQYFERRKPYQLVWAIALFIWFIGSLSQFLWEVGVDNQVVYRSWYLAGAMLVPAYLGTGTLYLLSPRKAAHTFMLLVLLGTILATLLVATAILQNPLNDLRPLNPEGIALTGKGFFPFFPVIVLNILLNTYGTIALVGGALWSAAVFARQRTTGNKSSVWARILRILFWIVVAWFGLVTLYQLLTRPIGEKVLVEVVFNFILLSVIALPLHFLARALERRAKAVLALPLPRKPSLPLTIPYRVLSNILIAVGTLTAATGGVLGRFGVPEPHSMSLLLGILIIYLGFLRSEEVFQFYRFPFVGQRKALKSTQVEHK